jgi:hypothetical protein
MARSQRAADVWESLCAVYANQEGKLLGEAGNITTTELMDIDRAFALRIASGDGGAPKARR